MTPPKPFFRIKNSKGFRTYETTLFQVSVPKNRKFGEIMTIFCNHHDAYALFLDRKEVASLLRRKFKNGVDRRIQRANMSKNPLH